MEEEGSTPSSPPRREERRVGGDGGDGGESEYQRGMHHRYKHLQQRGEGGEYPQPSVDDMKVAFECFERSAHSGHVGGQCEYGIMLYGGYGVRCDWREAAQWFQRASDGGNVDASGWLAEMIWYGRGGLNKDKARATQLIESGLETWRRQASEEGLASACYRLGWCHHFGVGVEKDMSLAIEWYERAAEHCTMQPWVVLS